MYKKYFLLALTVLVLSILQLSFVSELVGGLLINLVFAFAFAFLIADRKDEAIFGGFLGGICLDLLGNGVFGISSFLFVAFLILSGLVKRYVLNNFFSHFILFVSFHMIYVLAVNYPARVVFVTALWGTLLSFVISYLVSFVHKNILHERRFI